MRHGAGGQDAELHQLGTFLRGRTPPAPVFRTPSLHRYVRHLIYLGLVLAFGSTSMMTAGYLLFALAATGYILLGLWFEARDLMAQFGERYRSDRVNAFTLWHPGALTITQGAERGA